MFENYDDMEEVDVNALIEATDWPNTPSLQALQGYKGTPDERKVALIAILKDMDAS